MAPPQPPLAMIGVFIVAILAGLLLFYLSRSGGDDNAGGLSQQQATSGPLLKLEGMDITEAAFLRDARTGIANNRIPCGVISPQPPEALVEGFKTGRLRIDIPQGKPGIVPRPGQRAEDASLLRMANLVRQACGATPLPGVAPGTPAAAASPQGVPGGAPPPLATQAPGQSPAGPGSPGVPAPSPTARPPGSTPALAPQATAPRP